MLIQPRFFDDSYFKINTGLGDGVSVAYALSNEPIGVGSLFVYIDGLLQDLTGDYTLSGSTVTFSSAPSIGQKITFRYIRK